MGFDYRKLLQHEMTRKEFLRLSLIGAVTVTGITGVIKELSSIAATSSVAKEAESGTKTGNVTNVADSSASGGSAVKFGTAQPTMPGGDVTHGEQIDMNKVGPWTLQGVAKGSETLQALTVGGERISTWPTDGRPSWIPGTPYVYNNDPNNHGGIVPAGGMTIDGEFVPAGAWVVQFRDFDDAVVVSGSNGSSGTPGSSGNPSTPWYGVVFRGCRWRMNSSSVGWINNNGETQPGGKIWIHYSDAGGLGGSASQFCEIPIKIVTTAIVKRNYLSHCTTAVQNVGNPGAKVMENYIERLTTFNTSGPHINGISVNGGDVCYQIERNHVVAQQQEDSGSGKAVDQTDCIAMFQDFGNYPGTGTNDDGTQGYRLINNYLGGTGYVVYAGAGSQGTVSNMQWIGNKFTTIAWPNGGSYGPLANGGTYTVQFGSNGNLWQNNTWADDYGTGTGGTDNSTAGRQYPSGNGPRAGTTISA